MTEDQVQFVPTVAAGLRDAVESLFFFNPRQGVVRDGIRSSVEEHGVPEIMERDGRIWIGVPSGATQCLFACHGNHDPEVPAGVVLFSRPTPEILSITHLAVAPAYAAAGNDGNGLGLVLVEKVRQIARRMNGVRRLQLPYRTRCFLTVS